MSLIIHEVQNCITFLYVVFICVLVCVGYTVVDVFVYELSCADTWVRIHTHVCVCVCVIA